MEGIPFTKLYINDQRCDWKGPEDVTARAALRYDAAHLFIAVRVFDNNLVNTNSTNPAALTSDDAVEIFLDGRAMAKQAGDDWTPDVFQVVFAPPSAAFPAPVYQIVRPQRRYWEGLAFAAAPQPNGWTLEMRIPLYNFKFRHEAKDGASFGFDLVVDDRDEPKPERTIPRSRLRWSGKPEAEANPALFGRIMFENKINP
jgi:hypothetical protein